MNEQDDDEFALLPKNFNKCFRKVSKQTKLAPKVQKNTKGKVSSKPTDFFNRNKDILCKAYGRYGHIQSKCANTLKKKKAMTTSWSDGDFEESQDEEEDHVSNVELAQFLSTKICSRVQKKIADVAIETVHYYNNIVLVDDVATSEKQYDVLSNSRTKSNEDSDFDDNAFQEAYQHM